MTAPGRRGHRLRRSLVGIILSGGATWCLAAAVPNPPAEWTPPLGVPSPPFGIVETAPPAPSPWVTAVTGFYYVDPSSSAATDTGNSYGTPSKPRSSIPTRLPAGAVVELHGVYDRAHSSPSGIQADGTEAQPVFIRGASASDKADIVRSWEVSGSYVVLEHLRFRARDKDTTGSLVLLSPANHIALRHSEVTGNLKGGGLGVESWYGLSTVSEAVIWDNKVHDNGDVAADFDQDVHGIHIGSRVHNVWVVDNEMWRNSGDGIQISARTALLQRGTHHIYVGRNVAHHNKQNGFWTKQAADVIFSQNVSYANRPSNSSPGAGLGFQYAPSYAWFLFNHVYDSDYGIASGSDSGLGIGTETFFIGNLIHGIHNSLSRFRPDTAWQNCGISLPGGVNRYIVNNTLYDVDSGICSPDVTGRLELHNNIVFGVRKDGQHVFLEFPQLAVASKASGNVFGPGYRALTAGVSHQSDKTARGRNGGNSVTRDPGFTQAARSQFDLLPTSPAIDAGVDDPAGVYAIFQQRYGLDIRRDMVGRVRPTGRSYDAGAFEPPERPSSGR